MKLSLPLLSILVSFIMWGVTAWLLWLMNDRIDIIDRRVSVNTTLSVDNAAQIKILQSTPPSIGLEQEDYIGKTMEGWTYEPVQ